MGRKKNVLHCTQWGWLLSLREFQSCLSALAESFLFRERLRPLRPPVVFLPGTCEEKTAGQRIWAAGDKRVHVGSMPACLAITKERAFACPLHPKLSASLCGCERHDLVRCEWELIGWQPFSGGFRRGRVIGLCDWPRPLAVICFTQRQTQSGWRAHLRYDKGCQLARPRMVSTWGAISQLDKWFLPGRHQEGRHQKDPLWLKQGVLLDTSAQKEGCHERHFQREMGNAVRGQTDLQPLIWRGVGPTHQLPRNASSVSGLSIIPAGHTGTPCASTLRQQVRGVIHKSPGRPRLKATLHAGEWPSCVGSELKDACARHNEPRSRHVVEEQCLFRGTDAPPAHGSDNLGSLWQSSSRPLHLWRQLSLPNLFLQLVWMPWPTNGPAFRSMLSPQSLCYRRYSGESGNNGTSLF